MYKVVVRKSIGAALAAVLSLGLVTVGSSPARAQQFPLTVVAVGDAFASGEGAIGPIGVGWSNAACHRSPLAGPQLAASALGPTTSFTSLACTGTTIFGAGTTGLLGTGGQLASLPGGTIDALTVSIGAGDIGFSTVLTACMNPAGNCATSGLPSLVNSVLAVLPSRLDAVLGAVPGRVRHVFVTEYPDPTTGNSNLNCGTVMAPGFQGFEGISGSEGGFLTTGFFTPLNAALAAAVARANSQGSGTRFHYVGGIVSRFRTHGFCTGFGAPAPADWGNPRFVATPLDSSLSQFDTAGAMHPNTVGQQQISAALVDSMWFLTQPLSFDIGANGPLLVGQPVGLSVTARTANGAPAPEALVVLNGVAIGVTNAAGQWAGTWVPPTVGSHQISVDLDPHAVATRTLTVQARSYRVTSQPSPIPMNQAITLGLTATDTGTNQLVPGSFTLQHGTGSALVVRSGASAAVTVKAKVAFEPGPGGRPVRVLICPTLRFQPDSALYTARSFDSMINCNL